MYNENVKVMIIEEEDDMGKGGFTGFGGGNMGSLMKQAQKMQKDMAKMQEELEDKTVEASSGGGAVHVVVSGKKELKSITIKPEVIDPEDVDMIQDLILAAVNEGIRKADDMVSSEMGKITGGMGGLGGLF
jgi:DNA-binding YbaB/EbfC family protein